MSVNRNRHGSCLTCPSEKKFQSENRISSAWYLWIFFVGELWPCRILTRIHLYTSIVEVSFTLNSLFEEPNSAFSALPTNVIEPTENGAYVHRIASSDTQHKTNQQSSQQEFTYFIIFVRTGLKVFHTCAVQSYEPKKYTYQLINWTWRWKIGAFQLVECKWKSKIARWLHAIRIKLQCM